MEREYFEDRKRPSFIEKIRLWWKFEGRYYLKNFKEGIKKLWYWFPVIWKDKDYDHSYIYEVLKHKLKSQALYIGSRDIHTRADQDSRRMLICANLIDKLQEGYYEIEYADYIEDRSWFEPYKDKDSKEELYEWKNEIVSENIDDFFKKYPLVYKRVINGEGPFKLNKKDSDSEYKKTIAMNISHINKKRAHKLLFKIMEENIEAWWD